MKAVSYQRKFGTRILAGIVLCILFATSGFAAYVPGTTINMSAPNDFNISQGFSGFENIGDGSSITVSELPQEAYPDLSRLFSSVDAASQFSQKGINISGREVVEANGTEIPVLIGKQFVSGKNMTKYLALVKGEKTVLITFNIVDSAATTKSDAISSIKSIKIQAKPSLKEQIGLLNYTYKEEAPFKTTQILQGNTAMLATFEGTDPTGKKPLAIIALGSLNQSDYSAKELSEQLIRSTHGFQNSEILESKAEVFAGITGHYIKAAYDGRLIHQYLSKKGDHFLRFISLGERKAVEDLSKEILSVASSIDFKK